MTEGNIALTSIAQADGNPKIRPVVLLRRLPPFGDWLACGISTQLQQKVIGFDEILERSHPDFRRSGLKAESLIRLGFLAQVPANDLVGVIGSISSERHRRLLRNLSDFLAPKENS